MVNDRLFCVEQESHAPKRPILFFVPDTPNSSVRVSQRVVFTPVAQATKVILVHAAHWHFIFSTAQQQHTKYNGAHDRI
jgi:hypothetical protein